MAAAIARINHTDALNLLKASLNISHIVYISSKPHSESWSNVTMVLCHVTSATTALILSCACVELSDVFLDQPEQRHLVTSPLKESLTGETLTNTIESRASTELVFHHPNGYKFQTFCVSTLSHARFSWSITLFPGYGRPAVVCLPLVAVNVTTYTWNVTCIPTSWWRTCVCQTRKVI